MMGKININKSNEIGTIRTARQSDVTKTDKGTQAGDSKIAAATSSGDDKLQLSNQASGVGKLVDQLKELPDVRSERVEALREQITSGNYNPSSEDIADAILKKEGE